MLARPSAKKNGAGGLIVTVLLLDQIPGDLQVDEDVTLPSGSDAKKIALSRIGGSGVRTSSSIANWSARCIGTTPQ